MHAWICAIWMKLHSVKHLKSYTPALHTPVTAYFISFFWLGNNFWLLVHGPWFFMPSYGWLIYDAHLNRKGLVVRLTTTWALFFFSECSRRNAWCGQERNLGRFRWYPESCAQTGYEVGIKLGWTRKVAIRQADRQRISWQLRQLRHCYSWWDDDGELSFISSSAFSQQNFCFTFVASTQRKCCRLRISDNVYVLCTIAGLCVRIHGASKYDCRIFIHCLSGPEWTFAKYLTQCWREFPTQFTNYLQLRKLVVPKSFWIALRSDTIYLVIFTALLIPFQTNFL